MGAIGAGMTYREKKTAAHAWGLAAACAIAISGTFVWYDLVGRPHALGVFLFGIFVGHGMRAYVGRALARGHP